MLKRTHAEFTGLLYNARERNFWTEGKDAGRPSSATNPPIICALKQPQALSGSPRVRMNALLHYGESGPDIIISGSSPKCRRVAAPGDVIIRLAALFQSRSCSEEREILQEILPLTSVFLNECL